MLMLSSYSFENTLSTLKRIISYIMINFNLTCQQFAALFIQQLGFSPVYFSTPKRYKKSRNLYLVISFCLLLPII